MRHTMIGITLVTAVRGGLSQIAQAQTTAPPTIHNVRLNESAGLLTIIGTGFGRGPRVTIAGQPVAVLSGGTETQIDVVAPLRC